jgi:hypothetical protein
MVLKYIGRAVAGRHHLLCVLRLLAWCEWRRNLDFTGGLTMARGQTYDSLEQGDLRLSNMSRSEDMLRSLPQRSFFTCIRVPPMIANFRTTITAPP